MVPVKHPGGGQGPGHRLVRHLKSSARLLLTSLHSVRHLSNASSSKNSSPESLSVCFPALAISLKTPTQLAAAACLFGAGVGI